MCDPVEVSVALCTYNGERYLLEQLQSLVGQTRLPDELVIVDDGSVDRSCNLIREFAAVAPFPVLLHRNERNLGYALNFERAISLTSGRIIFLCDQDDVWCPTKIEKTIACFISNDVLLVHTDAHLVDGSLRPLGVDLLDAIEFSTRERSLFAERRGYEVLLKRNVVTGSATAVRRTLFEAARPFEPGFVHDEWLAIVASMIGHVGRVDEPLFLYRQHGNNQIGAKRRKWSERHLPKAKLGRQFHLLRAERLERVKVHLVAKELQVERQKNLKLTDAIGHARFRAELPAALSARIGSVFRELCSGRYRRYSNGWRGAVRDVFEAALTD